MRFLTSPQLLSLLLTLSLLAGPFGKIRARGDSGASGPVKNVSSVSPDFSAGTNEKYADTADVTGTTTPPDGVDSVWFNRPALGWENEAMPIGNGFVGGMVFGGVAKERIQFNEHSLWSGSEADGDTGAYQAFGNIFFDTDQTKADGYCRELNLTNGLQRISYNSNGVRYQRDYFCSGPAQVMVLHYAADRDGAYNGVIRMTNTHDAQVTADGNKIMFSGKLRNGLAFEAQLLVLNDGGTVSVEDNNIRVNGARNLTLLLAAGTSYVPDYQRGYLGDDPHDRLGKILDDASAKSFDQLETEHVTDYQSYFQRCQLDLGASDPALTALPIDARMNKYKSVAMGSPDQMNHAASIDPGLEKLLFDFGRYLMISSSRPGSLPANLQGMWNMTNNPPWRCDYHSDINIEMNYWMTQTSGLPDLAPQFLKYVESIHPVWIDNAHRMNISRGWIIHGENNIFGAGSWDLCKTANAWYCQHFWENYAFTQDKDFLSQEAYPILKETCQYWEDHLKALPDGRLVVPQGFSPEHGPTEDGVTFDQELVWDLFSNYIDAEDILGTDPDYRAKISDMRDHLVKPVIGKHGQLQEWMEDIDDMNDQHRHCSHLVGLFPGRQISPDSTPDLANAAKVSLIARGDGGTGWSLAWKINFWARLQDGDHAYRMVASLLKGYILTNLFDICPPFQIDGNLGYVSGIDEMLLQSQTQTDKGVYQLRLLPGLTHAWPTGSVTGLRARGAFSVDLKWDQNQLTSVTIHSLGGTDCRILYGDKSYDLHLQPNSSVTLDGELQVKG
jgi:alpha-L-fucosidase 2